MDESVINAVVIPVKKNVRDGKPLAAVPRGFLLYLSPSA